MTLTRKILAAFLIFFALILLVALFLPDHYRVERSVTVNAAADSAFQRVIDFRSRAGWDPWVTADSTVRVEYDVKPGFIGSFWRWTGNKIGEGKVEITAVKPGRSFESRLYFYRPGKMEAHIRWIFTPQGDKTQITWIISGQLSYPVNRIFGLFIDSVLGGSMERGLKNLKFFISS